MVNTRSMSMSPMRSDGHAEMDLPSSAGVSLRLVLSGDVFRGVVPYPIIVESWDKRRFGRVRLRWESEFTKAERRGISNYYARFYRWYLISGTPHKVTMQPKTVDLLRRAVDFFASI